MKSAILKTLLEKLGSNRVKGTEWLSLVLKVAEKHRDTELEVDGSGFFDIIVEIAADTTDFTELFSSPEARSGLPMLDGFISSIADTSWTQIKHALRDEGNDIDLDGAMPAIMRSNMLALSAVLMTHFLLLRGVKSENSFASFAISQDAINYVVDKDAPDLEAVFDRMPIHLRKALQDIAVRCRKDYEQETLERAAEYMRSGDLHSVNQTMSFGPESIDGISVNSMLVLYSMALRQGKTRYVNSLFSTPEGNTDD